MFCPPHVCKGMDASDATGSEKHSTRFVVARADFTPRKMKNPPEILYFRRLAEKVPRGWYHRWADTLKTSLPRSKKK